MIEPALLSAQGPRRLFVAAAAVVFLVAVVVGLFSTMNSLAYFAHPLATVAPRDLLLLQWLGAKPTDTALEIGTGSGSSLIRLAPSVAALHGLDVAEEPIARLQRILPTCKRPARDVQLFRIDFCAPGAAEQLPTRYDLIYSCDTLEHVPDPQAFLTNVYQALRPGGSVFLTYPNEHPSRAHGITFVERRQILKDMLTQAGFAPDSVRIDTLQMGWAARQVLNVTWWLPRRLAKSALKMFSRTPGTDGPPQTFDQTDFFAAADRLERWAPLINAYCWGVMKATSLARPVYTIQAAPDVIWDRQVLIRATRQSESRARNGEAGTTAS